MADAEVKRLVDLEEQAGKGEKWVQHYCSNHQILLVGEGDFSFSLCLAQFFGSASNIVASSRDSYDDVINKYKNGKSNLQNLKNLGACLLHEVDATKMKLYSDLRMRRFDRIIFNFPHAGFYGNEDNPDLIKMHKDLVFGFLMNARSLLRANGEIHVNHKIGVPYNEWNIEELASQSLLLRSECVEFKKKDYPGYNNKRGHGLRCDESFNLGKCCTFKFICNPRAKKENMMRKHIQQRKPSFLENQVGVERLPILVDLSYYPQTNHNMRMSEGLCSVISSRNEYSPIFVSNSNNVAEILRRAAADSGYSGHRMRLDFKRYLQPWPASIDPRYSQTDNVRKMDVIPPSLTALPPFRSFGGISSLEEELGRRSKSAYYLDVPREFQRLNN